MNLLKMLTKRPLGILLSFGVVCVLFSIALGFGLRWQKNRAATKATTAQESVETKPQAPPTKATPPAPDAPKESAPAPAAPKESAPAPDAPKESTPTPDAPKESTPAPDAPKENAAASNDSKPPVTPPTEVWVPLNPLGGDSTELIHGPPSPEQLERYLAAKKEAAKPAEEAPANLWTEGWVGPPHPVPEAFVGIPYPTPEATPSDVIAVTSTTANRDMEQQRDLEAEAKAINSTPLPQTSNKSMSSAGNNSKAPAFTSWEVRKIEGRDYVTANSLYRFYRFNSYSVEGKNVWFRSPVLIMKAAIGSKEMLINNIKFVLSYPVVSIGGQPCISRLDLCKLIDPILRPSYIGNAGVFDTVIIDAGHGGHDSGARGLYGYEKDFALKLAYALKAVLERQGLKVVMTRKDDTFISLGGRVAIANKIPNSIYISLHYNSSDGSSATGIETFALSPQGSASVYGARSVDAVSFKGNERDSENIALATAVHAAVIHHFKLVDRGVKRARWSVLTGLNRPGILFEGGFVTNPNDARFIAAENFRREMAATIGQAVMNYRRALQPRTNTTAPSRTRRR